jgi:hypothetical protein
VENGDLDKKPSEFAFLGFVYVGSHQLSDAVGGLRLLDAATAGENLDPKPFR